MLFSSSATIRPSTSNGRRISVPNAGPSILLGTAADCCCFSSSATIRPSTSNGRRISVPNAGPSIILGTAADCCCFLVPQNPFPVPGRSIEVFLRFRTRPNHRSPHAYSRPAKIRQQKQFVITLKIEKNDYQLFRYASLAGRLYPCYGPLGTGRRFRVCPVRKFLLISH